MICSWFLWTYASNNKVRKAIIRKTRRNISNLPVRRGLSEVLLKSKSTRFLTVVKIFRTDVADQERKETARCALSTRVHLNCFVFLALSFSVMDGGSATEKLKCQLLLEMIKKRKSTS